jgi:hypothetical protein
MAKKISALGRRYIYPPHILRPARLPILAIDDRYIDKIAKKKIDELV